MFSIPWPTLRVAFARLQPLRVFRFALDAPRTRPPPRGLPANQKQMQKPVLLTEGVAPAVGYRA